MIFKQKIRLLFLCLSVFATSATLADPLVGTTGVKPRNHQTQRLSAAEKSHRLAELLPLMVRLINQKVPIRTTDTIHLKSAELLPGNGLRLNYRTAGKLLLSQEQSDFSRTRLKENLCANNQFSTLLAYGARLELRLFVVGQKKPSLTERFSPIDCPTPAGTPIEKNGNIFQDPKNLPKFVAEFNRLCPVKLDSTLEIISLSMPTKNSLVYRVRYTLKDPRLADPDRRKTMAEELEQQVKNSGCSALSIRKMTQAGITVSHILLDHQYKKITATRFKPTDCGHRSG